MKQCVAVILAASTLLLAGCCTARPKWEYKVTVVPLPAGADERNKLWGPTMDAREQYFNGLGAEGWMLVSEQEGVFYFMRARR